VSPSSSVASIDPVDVLLHIPVVPATDSLLFVDPVDNPSSSLIVIGNTCRNLFVHSPVVPATDSYLIFLGKLQAQAGIGTQPEILSFLLVNHVNPIDDSSCAVTHTEFFFVSPYRSYRHVHPSACSRSVL